MTRSAARRAALLLPTLLLLAGCAAPTADPGTDPGSGESAAPAPEEDGLGLPAQTVGSAADCSLYSAADLSALWGVELELSPGTVIEGGGAGGILYACEYGQVDGGFLSVNLTFREHPTDADAATDFAGRADAAAFDGDAGIENEDVAVGDEAFIEFDADTVGTPDMKSESLYVRTGSLVLQINASDLNGIQDAYRDLLVQSYDLAF